MPGIDAVETSGKVVPDGANVDAVDVRQRKNAMYKYAHSGDGGNHIAAFPWNNGAMKTFNSYEKENVHDAIVKKCKQEMERAQYAKQLLGAVTIPLAQKIFGSVVPDTATSTIHGAVRMGVDADPSGNQNFVISSDNAKMVQKQQPIKGMMGHSGISFGMGPGGKLDWNNAGNDDDKTIDPEYMSVARVFAKNRKMLKQRAVPEPSYAQDDVFDCKVADWVQVDDETSIWYCMVTMQSMNVDKNGMRTITCMELFEAKMHKSGVRYQIHPVAHSLKHILDAYIAFKAIDRDDRNDRKVDVSPVGDASLMGKENHIGRGMVGKLLPTVLERYKHVFSGSGSVTTSFADTFYAAAKHWTPVLSRRNAIFYVGTDPANDNRSVCMAFVVRPMQPWIKDNVARNADATGNGGGGSAKAIANAKLSSSSFAGIRTAHTNPYSYQNNYVPSSSSSSTISTTSTTTGTASSSPYSYAYAASPSYGRNMHMMPKTPVSAGYHGNSGINAASSFLMPIMDSGE